MLGHCGPCMLLLLLLLLGPGDPEEKLVSHARSNLDLTRYDLSTLKPMEWLNDECMNMYMALLQVRLHVHGCVNVRDHG